MRARVRWWLGALLTVVALLWTPGCAASWESQAAGYARELGFTFYAPQGEALHEGSMTSPVRVGKFVDERGPGVSIDYDRFALREYKSTGVLTANLDLSSDWVRSL